MNTLDHAGLRRSPAPTASGARSAGSSGLLTLKQVAKLLGVSSITVRRRVREGALSSVRIKGRLYFQEAAVRGFVERHAVPAWSGPGM